MTAPTVNLDTAHILNYIVQKTLNWIKPSLEKIKNMNETKSHLLVSPMIAIFASSIKMFVLHKEISSELSENFF